MFGVQMHAMCCFASLNFAKFLFSEIVSTENYTSPSAKCQAIMQDFCAEGTVCANMYYVSLFERRKIPQCECDRARGMCSYSAMRGIGSLV